MSKGLPTRPRRHGRRGRKGGLNSASASSQGSITDASSVRHDSDEEFGDSSSISNGLL